MLSQPARSRKKGSTLYFATAATILLIFTFVVATTISGAAILHAQLADRLEKVSLMAARLLNANDVAGQINNITAASRQLVFDSRSSYDEASTTNPALAPIARSLLDESREGAQFVAKERDKFIKGKLDEVKAMMRDANSNEQRQGETFAVPWLVGGHLKLDTVSVGYADGCESNVEYPLGYQALMALDKALIDSDTRVNHPGNEPGGYSATESCYREKLDNPGST